MVLSYIFKCNSLRFCLASYDVPHLKNWKSLQGRSPPKRRRVKIERFYYGVDAFPGMIHFEVAIAKRQ
jgi:hypothetical protein